MTVPQEIGGYFELDLPDYEELYPEALGFQSARSAFLAILQASDFEEVWLPNYICDSMFESARLANVRIQTYSIDQNLVPVNLPESIPINVGVLYVNYFGLSTDAVSAVHQIVPSSQLIIDNSQALYSSPTSALATIYSPRKFVGLPDGGLVYHSDELPLMAPLEEDYGSIERLRHLMLRTAYSARNGYHDYQMARLSLVGQAPLRMSALTRRLMKSIRWSEVSRIRRRNFDAMHALLGNTNAMSLLLDPSVVPLCYPWMVSDVDIESVKARLASRGVFVPTYWPDALPRLKKATVEQQLLQNTLFLPMDQRMDIAQVEMVCELVLKLALGH